MIARIIMPIQTHWFQLIYQVHRPTLPCFDLILIKEELQEKLNSAEQNLRRAKQVKMSLRSRVMPRGLGAESKELQIISSYCVSKSSGEEGKGDPFPPL